MINLLEILEDEDEDIVFNNVVNLNHIIAHVVEDLGAPLEDARVAVLPRRDPGRNQYYVEHTIPLYTIEEFRMHFRMSRQTFQVLLNEIGNRLPPTRQPQIDLEKKVLFSIWILAKPESFLACGDRFGIAQSSGHFIYRQIVTILSDMVPEFIVWPTHRQCEENSEVFRERSRGIPNVIGAIDGTHIFIKQPVGNAVDYYNRYQCHSVILQAVCDPSKKFINISVGHPGRMHDARAIRRSGLYGRITSEDNPLILPQNHIIGDCAYPLLQELLTPFRDTGHLTERHRLFNVRFSSIRSVIERAFALLKGKWRRLKYLDMSDIDLINKVISATCVLHNLIIQEGNEEDELEVLDDIEQDVADIGINERRRHQLGEIKRLEIMNNLH